MVGLQKFQTLPPVLATGHYLSAEGGSVQMRGPAKNILFLGGGGKVGELLKGAKRG